MIPYFTWAWFWLQHDCEDCEEEYAVYCPPDGGWEFTESEGWHFWACDTVYDIRTNAWTKVLL